jgi:hypothetical protein
MNNHFSYRMLILLLSLALFQSCKEDEENIHPTIQTLEITTVSSTSALLKGNITNIGKYPVMDHGFVYGPSADLNENWGTKVSLGKDIPDNMYSTLVDRITFLNQYNNRTLYARAYLTNNKGTVYGQVVSVLMPSPNVQSIVPTSGKAGDRITITGQFFTSNKDELDVIFGNAHANIIEISHTKIVVEVPTGITNYYYSYNQIPVTLNMAGQTLNVTSSFRINPSVKDFSPKEGNLGTIISISGENFYNYNSNYNTVRVLLGQTEVPVNYSQYGIQITVPNTITSDKLIISVIIDGVTTVLPGEFSVTPPVVTSISPTSGLPGSSFSIFGNNFASGYSGYYDYYLKVKMGEVPVSFSSISSGQLTLTVPTDMPVGEYKITITAGPHIVEAPQKYTVLAPSISSFSPTSGSVGKEIVLLGQFLPNQNYQVYFGSVSTNAYSSSSSTLRVAVPAGLDPGKVKISIQYGSQTIVAADEFTVVVPSITSFSPTSGVAGTVVTITGQAFNPNAYYTTVKFGTIETSILSITETAIRVMVPSNAPVGAMKLSVINNGHTTVSTDNFTVTR